MSYHTDVAELTKFIHLPNQPASVRWQTYPKGTQSAEPGPDDWELVAVLEYEEASIQELVEQMELQLHPSELYVNLDSVREWFPEPVKQSFVKDKANPDFLRLVPDRYKPDLFSMPPLLGGHVFVVGNLLVVNLHTM